MNVQLTLATRIGQKSIAIDKEKAKLKTKIAKIKMDQDSLPSMKASIDQRQAEVDLLIDLKLETDQLTKRRNELQAYTDGLVDKFNAYGWRPDQPDNEKIESTDYAEKIAERQVINTRLVEIEKLANKTYYRR